MSIQDAPLPASAGKPDPARPDFRGRGVRPPEWIIFGFFAYLAAISPWFTERPDLHHQPIELLAGVAALIALLVGLQRTRISKVIDCIRDWIPLGLTLVAFRSMEIFIPAHFTHHYERVWLRWDQVLLGNWGLRHVIESLGWLIPGYLELCYLLVYGTGAFCLLVLYFVNRRRGIDTFYAIYLAGTLAAYALFPYFPSQPPRMVFPHIDPPTISTIVREWNLWILRTGSIHSSVFPSAHVSSAFAAAWAMLLIMPKRRRYGWALLIYAVSVSLATIYGRYHYAADVAAGFGISVAAAVLFAVIRRKRSQRHTEV
ncbi:MAG TPA: phosphatase PAP2 family protein [Bryobacteraceae bacterium]|nr:phosphatase PAP2 family protein [Bryobacteraceae bacterium]